MITFWRRLIVKYAVLSLGAMLVVCCVGLLLALTLFYSDMLEGCSDFQLRDATLFRGLELPQTGQVPQTSPQWSPDGNLIAFSHIGVIYTVRPDGTELQVIAGDPLDTYNRAHSPSISPDGSRIAYSAFKHDSRLLCGTEFRWEIVTSELDGSDRRRLTRSDDRWDLHLSPVWSPDGTHIAFVSNRDGFLRFYTMAADGSNMRGVASSVATEYGLAPAWSPDGRSLLFVGLKEDSDSGGNQRGLYTVEFNGAGLRRLDALQSPPDWVSAPVWSPDGNRIAFLKYVNASSAPFGRERKILAVDRDGSNLSEVLDYGHVSVTDISGLSWSPHGARILFSGRKEIGVVEADGSNARLLTDIRAMNFQFKTLRASLSPDGSSIAVYVPITSDDLNHDDGSDTRYDVPDFDVVLFTMNPEGLNKRTLVTLDSARQGVQRGQVISAGGRSWLYEHEQLPYPELTPRDLGPPPVDPEQETGLWESVPCVKHPNNTCVPRDVGGFQLFVPIPEGVQLGQQRPSDPVEDVLKEGWLGAAFSPVHISLQGTAQEGSVRCDWRGYATTARQRELAIRFWLSKSDDDPLPSPVQAEAEFMSFINGALPRYRDYLAASYIPIARGGLSTEIITLACYVDFTVGEYLLGNGPNEVTVSYDVIDETRSYDLYSRSHAAGEFGPATSTQLMSEGEYQASLDRTVWEAEAALVDILKGYESVVFLAPMGAHHAIAVEAWQAVAQWDVQMDEDGTVNALRCGPGRP